MLASFARRFNLGFFTVILLVRGLVALKLARLDVPGIVSNGTNVTLSCQYDLGKDTLYSLKWYKNRVEFYRYLPSDTTPGQTYDLPGVHVDLEQSNGSHVVLRKTDFATEGSYRCEISAESPSFQTITAEKDLHVYHLPDGGPQITGLEGQYDVGDYLNLTCSTRPSKPKAKLEWLLNGKKVPLAYQRHRTDKAGPNGVLTTSEVTLVKMLQPNHFPRGVVTVTCLATLEQLDSSCSRELIIPDTSQWTASYQMSESAPGQTPPIISGDVRQYNTGDQVTLNCTSTNTTPTKLKWLLNGSPANESQLVEYRSEEDAMDNGTTSDTTMGLNFRLLPHHFKNHEVRIMCVATTFRVVHLSNEAVVEGSAPLHTQLQLSETAPGMEVKTKGEPNDAVARQPASVLLSTFVILIWISLL